MDEPTWGRQLKNYKKKKLNHSWGHFVNHIFYCCSSCLVGLHCCSTLSFPMGELTLFSVDYEFPPRKVRLCHIGGRFVGLRVHRTAISLNKSCAPGGRSRGSCGSYFSYLLSGICRENFCIATPTEDQVW